MKVEELQKLLKEMGVYADFSVSDQIEPTDGLPNGKTVLQRESDGVGWTVFYTERGQIFDRLHFDSEDEATSHVYRIATRDNPEVFRLSPEEQARAKRIADVQEEQYREALRAKGLDPDTGRPLGQGSD